VQLVVVVVLGVGEQLDKVVQVEEALVVTTEEEQVLEHKETLADQVEEVVQVPVVAEDVLALEAEDKAMVEDLVEVEVHTLHPEVLRVGK
jgi:hypothetical protein